MIKSIHLTNFQGHEDSKLEFDPGVNVIIGGSDKGKSSIMRAFNWVFNNRPLGNANVSHWAKDEKGKIIKPSCVTLRNDKGEVQRIKNNDFNGYTLHGQTFEALRADVPESIQTFLNVSEVNLQKQMDKPFLIANTSGEVARFFNKVIKIDDIDKILAYTESKKRGVNNTLKNLETDTEETELKIKKLDWIDKVKPLTEKADTLNTRIEEKKQEGFALQLKVEDIKENKKYISEIESTLKIEPYFNKLNKINNEMQSVMDKGNALIELLAEYRNSENLITELNRVHLLEKNVDEAMLLQKKLELKEDAIYELTGFKEKSISYTLCINSAVEKIKTLEEQMPDTCPVCGGKI